MRSYLERIAAAAITPGGTFHPMPGSLYARPSDFPATSHALPEAEPLQPVQRRPSAGTEPLMPMFDQELPTPSGRDSPPPSPFQSVVQPQTAPPPSSSTSQAAMRQDLPARIVPQIPSLQEEVPQAGISPLIRVLHSPVLSSAQIEAHTPGRAKAQSTAPTASVPVPRKQTPESASASSSYEAQPDTLSQPAASPASLKSGPASPGQSAFQSLIPSSNATVIPASRLAQEAPPEARLASEAPPKPLLASEVLPAPRPDEPIPAASAPSPQQSSPYQPLVDAYTSPSIRSSAAAQSRQQNSRPEATRTRPLPEQREPDEIQIHIGRIEVTAVAPAPAARTQPTAIRKTPSLDDYLRRGNGRA